MANKRDKLGANNYYKSGKTSNLLKSKIPAYSIQWPADTIITVSATRTAYKIIQRRTKLLEDDKPESSNGPSRPVRCQIKGADWKSKSSHILTCTHTLIP